MGREKVEPMSYLLAATISFSFSILAPVRSATFCLFLIKMKVGMAVI